MIASFLIGSKIGLKLVPEKEQLQHNKHDEKLDENNKPKPFAQLPHVAKTIIIQAKGFGQKTHYSIPEKYFMN